MESQELRDGQEILNSMEDITTPSKELGYDSEDKKNRLKFRYHDDTKFDNPVVIRGTKKFLTPYENLMEFTEDEGCDVEELVNMCKELDSSLKLTTIEDISDVRISFVEEDSYMFLDCSDCNLGFGDPGYYIVPTYQKISGKSGPAFRKWSELLKIPPAYSKKNPGFLNETNFLYWKKILTDVKETPVPVDIVYLKNPVKINHPEEGLIQAYVVVNFLKSEVEKISKDEISIVHSKLENRVPLIGNVIEQVYNSVKSNFLTSLVKVKQYSFGYSGTNKGRHFVRLMLDGSDIEVNGDKLYPDIVIDTDFIGRDSDFGNVNISFGLFREICSNGAIINWNESQREKIMDKYVENFLLRRGIDKSTESYSRIKSEIESKFGFLFSSQGISLPVTMANSAFSSELFKEVLGFFLEVLIEIKENFEELTIPFVEVDEKKFISTVFNLSKSMKLPSDLVKMLAFEYIVGGMEDQEQIFKSPWDILNFMTFISKTYASKIQLNIQKKAYMFAYALSEIFVKNKKKDALLYNHYLRQINREGL